MKLPLHRSSQLNFSGTCKRCLVITVVTYSVSVVVRRHGSDALPVINTATSQTLQRISVELEKKV